MRPSSPLHPVHLLLLLVPLALACGDKETDEDEDDDDSSSTDDTATDADDTAQVDTCGGTPPVLVDLSCRNGGMQDNSGTQTPTMEFSADVTDEDGDLNEYTFVVSYDATADGVLSGETELGTSTGNVSVNDCQVFTAEPKASWFVDGAALPFSTVFDFGLSLVDKNGVSSEVGVITCQTPGSNGLGGGEVEL